MFYWLLIPCELLIVLALVQALIWHNNHVMGPRWQREVRIIKPFSDLIKKGFEPVKLTTKIELAEAVVLVGEVDGYAVELSFYYLTGWSKSAHYLVRVFFNTKNFTRSELLKRRQDKLAQSKFYRWNESIKLAATHVEQNIGLKKFSRPSSEFLLYTAKQLTAELQKLGLHPNSHEEGVRQSIINQE